MKNKLTAIVLIIFCVSILTAADVGAHFDNETKVSNEPVDEYGNYDAFIANGNPDTKYGDGSADDSYLIIGNETTYKTCRAIMNFTLPTILSGAEIISAELVLQRNTGNSGTYDMDLYKLLRSFDPANATWNDANTSDPWAVPGGDYVTLIDSVRYTFLGSEDVNITWDVTDTVREWYNNPFDNYGFLLKTRDENTTGKAVYFWAGNNHIPSSNQYGPILYVNYTTPDLVAVSIKVTPNNPMANTTVNINVTIENRGGSDSGQFTVGYYINDTSFDNSHHITSLAGNRTLMYDEIDYNYSAEGSSGIWGNNTFKVVVDYVFVIEETDETNNNITETVFFIYDYSQEAAASPSTSSNITANKWTWLGYLNQTSKSGAQQYSEISNCQYVVMQNTTTGYYYTYGPGITEDFTITYGSAVAILVSSDTTWDHT